MATTKKKYSPKPKTDVENTGAMDEFLDTVVGETIKEEDVIPKKPKAKPKPTVEDEPKVNVPENDSNEDATGLTADIEITGDTLMRAVYGGDADPLVLANTHLANIEEVSKNNDDENIAPDQIRVVFTTSVIDGKGNVLHWSTNTRILDPLSDSEALRSIEDDNKISEIFKNFLDEYIYKRLTDKPIVAEEVKPVDITPEVVAPKLVFPTRVVNRW